MVNTTTNHVTNTASYDMTNYRDLLFSTKVNYTIFFYLTGQCPVVSDSLYSSMIQHPQDPDMCYVYQNTALTWQAADDDCYSMRGYVMKIPDYYTQSLMQSSFSEMQTVDSVWLGARDETNPNPQWRRTSGTNMKLIFPVAIVL